MNVGPSYKLESAPHCPVCEKRLDGVFCVDGDATPSDGDWSVCIYCAAVLRFTVGQKLRLASDEELRRAPVDEYSDVVLAVERVRQLNAGRRR